MPRRDGTGPLGKGSMTGRGAGVCQTDRTASNELGIFTGRGRGMFQKRRLRTGNQMRFRGAGMGNPQDEELVQSINPVHQQLVEITATLQSLQGLIQEVKSFVKETIEITRHSTKERTE